MQASISGNRPLNNGQMAPRVDQESQWFQMEGPRRTGIDHGMINEVIEDFQSGFETLSGLPPAITVFGSARPKPGSEMYDMGVAVGESLAHAGFAVMTGGGPGLMEAVNRGAKIAGGYSIGINIKLPHEQLPNEFIDKSHSCDYFFPRKVLLTKYAAGFIGLPGGFGTLDELFEILTLRQTGKMKYAPVALVGKEFWTPLIDFLRERTLREGFIDKNDIADLYVTDSIDDAVSHITDGALRTFNLERLTCRRLQDGSVKCAA